MEEKKSIFFSDFTKDMEWPLDIEEYTWDYFIHKNYYLKLIFID
jgi:hypothetical protein